MLAWTLPAPGLLGREMRQCRSRPGKRDSPGMGEP